MAGALSNNPTHAPPAPWQQAEEKEEAGSRSGRRRALGEGFGAIVAASAKPPRPNGHHCAPALSSDLWAQQRREEKAMAQHAKESSGRLSAVLDALSIDAMFGDVGGRGRSQVGRLGGR
ncbi:hypothetical protein GCM10010431_80960 [Streptomyces kunmingensis]